jgi:hypothetical protein
MPVDGRAIVFEVVMNCYLYDIAPACLNPRTRVLVVEDFAVWIIDAITIDVLVCYVESVLEWLAYYR